MRHHDEVDASKDIEANGIPSYADDDTDAYDDLGQRALEDEPPAMPGDAPDPIDRYGTTAEEQRVGESLDARLAQEEPDVDADNPLGDAGRRLSDEVTGEAQIDEARRDADVLEDGPSPAPNLDSPVSMYDRPGVPGGADGAVGRLVQPDAGFGEDTEKDEIALDSGELRGASAEEAAMHEVPEDDL